jgi:nucleoside-diphosphate-sugar epimerase
MSPYNRVAVVGAGSQIGPSLIRRLAASGRTVLPIARISTPAAYIFDKASGTFSPRLDHADALISLAPLPVISDVVEMAKALKARRIIAFGSTGRFSKERSTSSLERDFASQQASAELAMAYYCAEANIYWTLFRPTMIYGAGMDQSVTFIAATTRRFGFFPVPMGARGLRQPVHVDDLAAACISALDRDITWNRAYNLGGGERLSYHDMVKRVFAAQGLPSLLLPVPYPLLRIAVALAGRLPKLNFIRREMVDRMFEDLVTDNHPASEDFGFLPRIFAP